MGKSRTSDEDSDREDADVAVERMPNAGDWELFRAVDEGDERWLLALRFQLAERAVEYALWSDPKSEPNATGQLDAREEKKTSWAKAIRSAAKHAPHTIDDDARAEIIIHVLERADPMLSDYEDRLSFSIESAETHEDEDDEDA